jgi:coenzyme F420-dependent glucose-6-phosphate dehydrogenase
MRCACATRRRRVMDDRTGGRHDLAMIELGYALSSEEHRPNDLVAYARRAEQAGFRFALISDHFHPWTDRQGQASLVWSVLGAIAHATERLRVGTGVTCPLLRIHPAVIAQAAATVADMMPDRFFLGLGTGENLNEHVIGRGWPPPDVRLAMLEEAIGVIRDLWKGGYRDHRGEYFTVENARLYTRPDRPPPIFVAAAGEAAATLAGRLGDGLVSTAPERETVERFDAAGGRGKPRYGQVTVCWARSEAEARRTAREWWPNAALPGPLSQELALPLHFEEAAKLVREGDVAKEIVCSPDADVHREHILEFERAGFDHVYVHQVGPDQEGFFRFYERHILPRFRPGADGPEERASARAAT